MIYTRYGNTVERITGFDPETGDIQLRVKNVKTTDYHIWELRADHGIGEVLRAIERAGFRTAAA